jgi:hypothetical protein
LTTGYDDENADFSGISFSIAPDHWSDDPLDVALEDILDLIHSGDAEIDPVAPESTCDPDGRFGEAPGYHYRPDCRCN